MLIGCSAFIMYEILHPKAYFYYFGRLHCRGKTIAMAMHE